MWRRAPSREGRGVRRFSMRRLSSHVLARRRELALQDVGGTSVSSVRRGRLAVSAVRGRAAASGSRGGPVHGADSRGAGALGGRQPATGCSGSRQSAPTPAGNRNPHGRAHAGQHKVALREHVLEPGGVVVDGLVCLQGRDQRAVPGATGGGDPRLVVRGQLGGERAHSPGPRRDEHPQVWGLGLGSRHCQGVSPTSGRVAASIWRRLWGLRAISEASMTVCYA